MIAIVAAPTNLGLRPLVRGTVPGTAKAPEALREAGLHARLQGAGAIDAGVVLPGRYVDDDATRSPGRVRNQDALVDHARRVAERLDAVLSSGRSPLVLGGDCSLAVAAGLARMVPPGRGFVHIDGHTDFRHPGGSEACASVGGEGLAAVIGMHWPAIADIDGRAPYFAAERVAHIGCRDDDEDLAEVRSAIGSLATAGDIRSRGADVVAREALAVADHGGFWMQIDVDVLDPRYMPAVDSPDPGGIDPDRLVAMLQVLAPRAIGAAVTIFDPDLDPDGRHAALLADIVVEGLGDLGRDRTA